MNRMPRFNVRRALLLLLLPIALSANASTVLQVGVSDLLEQSELVIHGRVTDSWTEFDASRNTVFTNVRIAIDDVIKGQQAGDSIVIKFEGGTHGARSISVGGLHMPIMGEEGVYFIEKPGRTQVNPLYGWQQGHFVVRLASDGRTKLIKTFDLRPVYGLEAARRSAAIGFSTGVPLGVSTEKHAHAAEFTLAAFKETLRTLAEDQR